MDALAPFSTEHVAEDTAYCMTETRELSARPGAAGLTTDMAQPSSHMLAAGQDGISQSWMATRRHLHCHSPCHPFHRPVKPYLRLQCLRVLACSSLARTISFPLLHNLTCARSFCETFEEVIISRWKLPGNQNAFRHQGHRSLPSQREGWREAADPRREDKASRGAPHTHDLGQ